VVEAGAAAIRAVGGSRALVTVVAEVDGEEVVGASRTASVEVVFAAVAEGSADSAVDLANTKYTAAAANRGNRG
jgi:hypothetical protein